MNWDGSLNGSGEYFKQKLYGQSPGESMGTKSWSMLLEGNLKVRKNGDEHNSTMTF